MSPSLVVAACVESDLRECKPTFIVASNRFPHDGCRDWMNATSSVCTLTPLALRNWVVYFDSAPNMASNDRQVAFVHQSPPQLARQFRRRITCEREYYDSRRGPVDAVYVQDLEAKSSREYGNAVGGGLVRRIPMDEEILRFVDNTNILISVEDRNLGSDLPIGDCGHERSEHVPAILKRVA